MAAPIRGSSSRACQGDRSPVAPVLTYELRAGDAILFVADVPHTYRNVGAAEAVMYLVMTYAQDVG